MNFGTSLQTQKAKARMPQPEFEIIESSTEKEIDKRLRIK
jgi:hypothetical protein